MMLISKELKPSVKGKGLRKNFCDIEKGLCGGGSNAVYSAKSQLQQL